jgi:hypothetical protein
MKPLLIILLIAIIHHTGKAQTVYVNKTATGAGDGTSWANAYTTIQEGMEEANVNTTVTEIRVAGGFYQEIPLSMGRYYNIRGSFDPATDQQNLTTHLTTLQPQDNTQFQLLTPVAHLNPPTVIIDGFRFYESKAGSISNQCGLVLLNTTFINAPVQTLMPLKTVNCLFICNDTYAYSPMIYIFPVSLATLASLDAINCTFFNNSLLASSIFTPLGNVRVSNSILWGNSLPEILGLGTVTLDRNIIRGTIAASTTVYITDSATVDARSVDPLFKDMAAGDLRLQYGSPAINSGSNELYEAADGDVSNNSIVTDIDIAGNKRINSTAIDLGAFERNALQQTISIADRTATYGDVAWEPAVNANTQLPIHYTSSDNNIADIITDAGGQKIRIKNKGTVSITATQDTDAALYDPAAPISFTVTVNPKPITVTAAQSKVYGDADPALTYSAAPALVAGDVFTGSLSRAPGENAGDYAILQNDLALNNNYLLTYAGGLFTIHQRPITVTAQASSKTYGEPDPAFNFAVAPTLLGSDALTGSLTRAAGTDAGNYAITQGNLGNNNYHISFVPATFTINKAPQHITWQQTLLPACDNNVLTLTGASSSGLPVQYAAANTSIATIAGNQLTIAGAGTTTITATQPGNHNYLPATSTQQTLTAKIPAHFVVKHWNDVLMFNNSSAAYSSWQWYKNGSPVNGATGQYYHESGNLQGEYYATVKNKTGETLTTCPINVTPGAATASIALFPNPATQGQAITVKTNYTAAQLQGASIVMTSQAGIVIARQQNVAPQTTLPMSFIPGLYVVRITLANGITHAANLLIQP